MVLDKTPEGISEPLMRKECLHGGAPYFVTAVGVVLACLASCAGTWRPISRPLPTLPSAGWTSNTNLKDGEQILIGPVTYGTDGTSIGVLFQETPNGDGWGWPVPINGKDHTLSLTNAEQNGLHELVVAIPAKADQLFVVKIFKQDGSNPTRYLLETTVGPFWTGPSQATLLSQPNGKLLLLVVVDDAFFCASATNDQGTIFSAVIGWGLAEQLKAVVNHQGRIGVFAKRRSSNPAGGEIWYYGQTQADAGCSFKQPVALGGYANFRLDAGIDATGRFQVISHSRFGGENRVQIIRQELANNDQFWSWPTFISPAGRDYAFPAVTTDALGRIVIAAEGPSGIEIVSQVDPQNDPAEYTTWWPMRSRLPNGTTINLPFWGMNRDGRLTLFGFNQTDHLYYVRTQRARGTW